MKRSPALAAWRGLRLRGAVAAGCLVAGLYAEHGQVRAAALPVGEKAALGSSLAAAGAADAPCRFRDLGAPADDDPWPTSSLWVLAGDARPSLAAPVSLAALAARRVAATLAPPAEPVPSLPSRFSPRTDVLWPTLRLSWSAAAPQESLSARTGTPVAFFVFLDGSDYDGIILGGLGVVIQYSLPPGPRTYSLGFPGAFTSSNVAPVHGSTDTLSAYATCQAHHYTPTLLITATLNVPNTLGPVAITLRDDLHGYEPTAIVCPTCGDCWIEPNLHNSLVLLPTPVPAASVTWGAIKSRYQ